MIRLGHYSKIKHSATKRHNSDTERDFHSPIFWLCSCIGQPLPPPLRSACLPACLAHEKARIPPFKDSSSASFGPPLSFLRCPFSPWLLLIITIIIFTLFRNNAPYSSTQTVDNEAEQQHHGRALSKTRKKKKKNVSLTIAPEMDIVLDFVVRIGVVNGL